jgi:replicative superfamily II helicase
LKDREVFKHKYLEGDIERIKPQLWEGSMATAVMNSVALGNCATLEEIKAFLRNSLTWKIYSSEPDVQNNQESKLDKGIRDCQYARVINNVDSAHIALTPLGKAATRMGVAVETAKVIDKWFEARIDSASINELEIFLLSSITDDGLDAYLNYSTSAYNSQRSTWLYRISDDIGKEGYQLIKSLVNQKEVNEYLMTKCIRNSYVYKDYISQLSNRDIEQKYELYLGSIRNASEQISWVVWSIAEIAKELGYAKELVERINLWAERLQYGISAAGIPLSRLRVSGLGRERIRVLVHQGFDNIEAIKELSIDALARWITKPVAERLARFILSHKSELPLPENIVEDPKIDNPKTPKDRLIIIGKMERNRTLIKLNDHVISLREKNFELLLRFALARFNGNEGWIHKMDLELPENGITQGISRLRESLSVLQLDSANSIIENNSNSHYRLALPPEQIEIDRDTIRQHWSTIIQDLVS